MHHSEVKSGFCGYIYSSLSATSHRLRRSTHRPQRIWWFLYTFLVTSFRIMKLAICWALPCTIQTFGPCHSMRFSEQDVLIGRVSGVVPEIFHTLFQVYKSWTGSSRHHTNVSTLWPSDIFCAKDNTTGVTGILSLRVIKEFCLKQLVVRKSHLIYRKRSVIGRLPRWTKDAFLFK